MIDLFGRALFDYYQGRQIAPLFLHTRFSTPDELDLDGYFFREDQFTQLEKYALDLCKGKVLDIGAAAGRHSLYLQRKGLNVTSLDISDNCAAIMREIGIQKVVCKDIYNYQSAKFDTLVMLMNGIGLVRNLDGLRKFLEQMKHLLKKGGQLILDSSDVTYLVEEYNYKPEGYIGEISYRYEYNGMTGPWFTWLYVRMNELLEIADRLGWSTQIIYENQYNEYLARLTVK